MKSFAILLVGGKSTRFESKVNKQLSLLNGKPVFSYPLLAIYNSKAFDQIIVVVNNHIVDEIKEYCIVNNIFSIKFAEAGETRQLSVENGLASITGAEADDIVLIHDGARPLLDEEIILRSIESAKTFGAVTTYLPMEDTVAFADFDGKIAGFADRSQLVKIQTPQTFKYGVIMEAHKYALNDKATDDCSLVMRTFMQVKLIEGSKKLAKLTTIDDLKYLETFTKWQNTK